MPIISRNGFSLDSKVVTGGIEKVAKNVFGLFSSEIIPVVITGEDRKRKLTRKIFDSAIEEHNPDFLFINDIDACFYDAQIKRGIPTIAVMHEPLCGDIRYLDMYKRLHEFLDSGGHLYFVSRNQLEFFKPHIKRVTGRELGEIKGFFRPSHCSGLEEPKEVFDYDAVTVGRTDAMKNPFLIHKKLHESPLKTCVVTNEGNFQKSKTQVKYYEENLKWKAPQYTFRGLGHSETMEVLRSSKVFISTMTTESFGITTLEALAHGVPVILFTDKSGNHASEIIPFSEGHIVKVHKSIKPRALYSIIRKLSKMDSLERMKISKQTKKKHSKENFKLMLDGMFNERIR